MVKIKKSANNLVTKTEFRKKMSQLEGKVETLGIDLRGEMAEMKKELKDQFFTGWDKLLKEVQTGREEFAAHFSAHKRIDEDLTKLQEQRSSNRS